MRRSTWWLPVACVVALGVVPAAAQTAPDLGIRIERDIRPRPAATELGAYFIVTLVERATGRPPAETYPVFGLTTNQRGEQSPIFDCTHANDTDPRVPRGVYHCTVFVDHGGRWDFAAVVNEPRTDPKQPPVTVARASTPFDLVTGEVYTGGDIKKVRTSATAVAVLWTHVLIAGGWFACVAALAALALPNLRRRISSFGLHRLEGHLDLLCRLTWSATGAVIGTGIYLLANETAYRTPLSTSKINATFALPYAKPYFLALGAKLALYALMVLAVIPLVSGAQRQINRGFGTVRSALHPAEAPQTRSEGAVLTATRQAPPEVERPAPLARLAVLVALFGALGISLCVTLLKYFHQLIEAS